MKTEQENQIIVNKNLIIKNVKYGKVFYFEGLNCEKGHIYFEGKINKDKVKGYQNIKTDNIYKLEIIK